MDGWNNDRDGLFSGAKLAVRFSGVYNMYLGRGFKYALLSPLLEEDSHFD